MFIAGQIVVVLMGVLIVLLSVWGIASPSQLMRVVRSVFDKSWGMSFAVIVRVILGISLLAAAPVSMFVILFKLLGWLALVAAVILPVIGRQRLVTVIDREPVFGAASV